MTRNTENCGKATPKAELLCFDVSFGGAGSIGIRRDQTAVQREGEGSNNNA